MGQEHDVTRMDDPLIKGLLEQKIITPHWTGIGVETDRQGRVITPDGRTLSDIFVVGPLRGGQVMVDEGRLGPVLFNMETLRQQAYNVAVAVLAL